MYNNTKPKYQFHRAKWYEYEMWEPFPARPVNQDRVQAMLEWCTEQFGLRALHINEVAEFSPRGVLGGKWLGSYYAFIEWGNVYFRHEEDATMFILRWV
jgi:hypothetical protein